MSEILDRGLWVWPSDRSCTCYLTCPESLLYVASLRIEAKRDRANSDRAYILLGRRHITQSWLLTPTIS